MQHEILGRRHRTALLVGFVAMIVVGACTAGAPAGDADARGGKVDRDASLAGAGGQGRGGAASDASSRGRAGTGNTGTGGGQPPPTADAEPPDGGCIALCFPLGGQYCGRIGYRCGTDYVECPPCQREGFTCGGSGVQGVCGAPRDSGACDPVACDQSGGRYCGFIGGGCGDLLDCGQCPPGFRCAGGGIAGVCASVSGCPVATCQDRLNMFCGTIGNGCNQTLDCGPCPNGRTCGSRVERVCSAPCPLCPQIVRCDGGVATTVSGTAVTAAHVNPDPLPGALVFIPNTAPGANLPPLADGPACRACPALTTDDVLVSAVTGPDGRFSLRDVPAGTGIPIVVQLGTWRMQTTIDVAPCVDNALPLGTVRLPRSQREGNIPLTAISTGQHDTLECLLRKMGIDDAEFTNPSATGRIHLYRSNGAIIDASTPDESVLKGVSAGGGRWSTYSQVLLACEGAETLETPEALGNFIDYVDRGGRVLATHFSYVWLFQNGPFAKIGAWTPGSASPAGPLVTDVVTSSPEGTNFGVWLGHAGALSRPAPPQIRIAAPHADLGALVTGASAELWLSSFSPPTSQAVAISTRLNDKVCGQIVFSDFHANRAASTSDTFPGECEPNLALSADEKALEYMLLYIGACSAPPVVQPPRSPPGPPLPPPLPPPYQPPLPPP